ncbi:hypothetical protein NONI108955_34980 [Nocardia ninae]
MSPQPMVTMTSAARMISSVQGLGYSLAMSTPISAMAATAAGLRAWPGSEPPDQATARPLARWAKKPRAIWERPALCVQRNSTVGRGRATLP